MPDSFVTIMMNARENTNRDCLKYHRYAVTVLLPKRTSISKIRR